MPAGLDSGDNAVTSKEKRVKQKLTVDNPGMGNCAFYAFANGLIHIIQEAGSDHTMFDRWAKLDPDVKGLHDAIRKFDFHNPDRKLLDTLQQSLRSITYKYKLDEIRQVCVETSRRLAEILSVCSTSDKLKEALSSCTTSNEKYIKLIEVCTTQNAMLAELIRIRATKKTNWNQLLQDCATSEDLFADLFKACSNSNAHLIELLKVSQKSGALGSTLRVRDNALKLNELLKACADKEVLAEVERVCMYAEKFPSLRACTSLEAKLAELKRICASNEASELRRICEQSAQLKQLFNAVDTSGEQLAELRRICTPDSEMLSELRRVLFISFIDNPYTVFSRSSSYTNFALVYAGTKGAQVRAEDVDPDFNEYANEDVRKLLDKIDASTVKTNHEDQTLVPLYMKLLYGVNDVSALTNQKEPDKNSPILAAIKRITRNYFWGTHTDLDYLSNAFKTNLHTLYGDESMQEFRDLPDRPTITLSNQGAGKKDGVTIGGSHWVTVIEVDKPTAADKYPPTGSPERPEKTVVPGSVSGLGLDSGPQLTPKPVSILRSSSPNTGQIAAQEKLSILLRKISNAVTDYNIHSNNIWFCFFHIHGATGRKRANDFRDLITQSKTYDDAMRLLCNFLSDKKNGNTHPHSFRTMLLRELLGPSSKLTLEQLSKNFNAQLTSYKNSIEMPVEKGRDADVDVSAFETPQIPI